jgi:glutamate dehydrogenase
MVKAETKLANPDPNLLKPLSAAMTAGSLPGESDGFDHVAATEAAAFMLATAMERAPGKPNIQIESFADHEGKLAIRIAISNDDMPGRFNSSSFSSGEYRYFAFNSSRAGRHPQ